MFHLLRKQIADNTSPGRGGFTLLELVVVAAVIGTLGTIAATVFISITRAYNKANVIAEIEQNGNLALTTMSNEIRNALSVSSTASGIEITNQEGDSVTFDFVAPTPSDNGYITRNGSAITDTDAQTGVNIVACDFEVDSTVDPPVVTLTITLEQPVGVPGRIDFQAETELTTTVSLRTYQ